MVERTDSTLLINPLRMMGIDSPLNKIFFDKTGDIYSIIAASILGSPLEKVEEEQADHTSQSYLVRAAIKTYLWSKFHKNPMPKEDYPFPEFEKAIFQHFPEIKKAR